MMMTDLVRAAPMSHSYEMTDAVKTASEWISDIVAHTGMRPSKLARMAGVSPSTVTRIYNADKYPFQPSLKTLQKLSSAAGMPIPSSVIQACGADNAETVPYEKPTPLSVREALKTLSHTKLGKQLTLPVRAVMSLPRELHPVGGRSHVVRCPPKLENDPNAFAFACPDNSLDPWVKTGSMLYATTSREPSVGDLVLVTDRQGRSKVRYLTDMDESGMVLSRPTPFGSDETLAYGDYEMIAVVAVVDRV